MNEQSDKREGPIELSFLRFIPFWMFVAFSFPFYFL